MEVILTSPSGKPGHLLRPHWLFEDVNGPHLSKQWALPPLPLEAGHGRRGVRSNATEGQWFCNTWQLQGVALAQAPVDVEPRLAVSAGEEGPPAAGVLDCNKIPLVGAESVLHARGEY